MIPKYLVGVSCAVAAGWFWRKRSQIGGVLWLFLVVQCGPSSVGE